MQIDGIASVLAGAERERLLPVYFAAYPDGRDRLSWEGIMHVAVRPTWARHSDFSGPAPAIVELGAAELGH